MIGKEVTPKTISHQNQKNDLCNQKLFPTATKDMTAQLVWQVSITYCKAISGKTIKQKTDTTAQLEKRFLQPTRSECI